MLGYGNVNMNGSPKTNPVRTLMPGIRIADSPDNGGALGTGSILTEPLSGDHGDGDLRQSNFTNGPPRFGIDYSDTLRGPHQDQFGIRVKEAYRGATAQAQALRRNVHFNLQGITRRIVSPDAMTQTEVGYTLPLQWFAYKTRNYNSSPAGKNVAGSTMASVQPSLQRAAPRASIPVAMPWNSAPGYGN